MEPDKLGQLVEEARTAKRPQHVGRHSPTSRAVGDGRGTWRCCDCGVDKSLADFHVSGGKVRSYCKLCRSKRDAKYRRTLRGNAKVLVGAARRRSKLKRQVSNLDVDFILDLILGQQGRCAYSGVQMEMLLPHSDWRMSLERLRNDVGYERENCVLVAAEFNTPGRISGRVALNAKSGSSKWSNDKVKKLPAERLRNVDLEGLGRTIEIACKRNGHSICSTGCFGPNCERNHLLCKHPNQRCGLLRRMTLRGHMLELLKSARRRHKFGKWQGHFELDLGFALEMLWSQQGRCFYSGVPLKYAQLNVDWMMSLERLDNRTTYTKDNTVLVALEFNTADNSMNKASSFSCGSSQWSRSKVEHVWGAAGSAPEVLDTDVAVSKVVRLSLELLRAGDS